MPSPFTGMDPYIESVGLWDDFHANLIGDITRAIDALLPEKYVARCGERYFIELASPGDLNAKDHRTQSDVAVTAQTPYFGNLDAAPSQIAVIDDPHATTMEAYVEAEFRETFIEIKGAKPDRHVVTTIEVLSPSNKRRGSLGYEQYLRKRQAHLMGTANLVEVDLLRRGYRMPMFTEWPPGPYYLLTSWRKMAPRCKVWPAFVNRPLPKLRIPLDPPDDDIVVDLQPMIAAIYDRSRYGADIDYTKPCEPPLDEVAQAWLAERIEVKGA